MPAPIDLTGRRFGKLLVLGAGMPELSTSGKTVYKTWRFVCDCGREETIRDHRLPYCDSNRRRTDAVEACSHCRAQRVCVVCGKTFESQQYRACCSDACQLVHKRGLYLYDYYRRVAKDPEFNKVRNNRRKEKAQADPAYKAVLEKYEAAHQERKKARMAADPAYREEVNARARRNYEETVDRTKVRRRESIQARIDAMSDAEYIAWAEKMREYNRLNAQRRRSTPEGRTRYLDYMREYTRQQALRQLMSAGDELIKRSLDNDE